VGRAGIAVKFGRLRHTHAFAFTERRDILTERALICRACCPA
jgi:hypothetical protein